MKGKTMFDTTTEEEDLDLYEEPEDNNKIELPLLEWAGPEGWREKAGCKGTPTELYFRRTATEQLLENCFRCSVRVVCLEYAIRNQIPFGVYGGFTATDRKGMTIEDIEYGPEVDEVGDQTSVDSASRQMEDWRSLSAWWITPEYWF